MTGFDHCPSAVTSNFASPKPKTFLNAPARADGMSIGSIFSTSTQRPTASKLRSGIESDIAVTSGVGLRDADGHGFARAAASETGGRSLDAGSGLHRHRVVHVEDDRHEEVDLHGLLGIIANLVDDFALWTARDHSEARRDEGFLLRHWRDLLRLVHELARLERL